MTVEQSPREPFDPADGWFPLDPEQFSDLFRERSMRAVLRFAHTDELAWVDLPQYGNGHITQHLLPFRRPLTLTMWMDDSEDRVARIVALGRQRYVVELQNAQGISVVEDPSRDSVEQPVGADARDVLGRGAVTAAQIIRGALSAETYARIWLDRGAVRADFRLVPR